MARSICIEYEGAVYHITIRGNEQKALKTDADRERFVKALADSFFLDTDFTGYTDCSRVARIGLSHTETQSHRGLTPGSCVFVCSHVRRSRSLRDLRVLRQDCLVKQAWSTLLPSPTSKERLCFNTKGPFNGSVQQSDLHTFLPSDLHV